MKFTAAISEYWFYSLESKYFFLRWCFFKAVTDNLKFVEIVIFNISKVYSH